MFFIALRTFNLALSYFFMWFGVKDIASDPYKRLSSKQTLTISFLKGTDKCLDDIASLYWLKFLRIAFVLFFISSSSLRSFVIILPRNLYLSTNRIQPPGTFRLFCFSGCRCHSLNVHDCRCFPYVDLLLHVHASSVVSA